MIFIHFDVIAQQASSFGARPPSPEGRRLWNALFTTYQGRVALIADEGSPQEILTDWLMKEGFKPSIVHIPNGITKSGMSPKAYSVWNLSATVGKPHWYVDIDANCCAEVLRAGIPSLIVAVPLVHRPEWNEKETIRSWDSVVEELESQALKKYEMQRGEE